MYHNYHAHSVRLAVVYCCWLPTNLVSSGLTINWHWGNLTIAQLPLEQPWIYISKYIAWICALKKNTPTHLCTIPRVHISCESLHSQTSLSPSLSMFMSFVYFNELHHYSAFHIYSVHYCDVIMGTMASQITSLTIVYSAVHSGPDQRKHQSSASLAFVWGIHRWPVNSPQKWPVTLKMLPFDDVIMVLKPITKR